MTRYHGSFLFEPIRARAARIFDETIMALAAGGKRVLRVLEVGTGTGYPKNRGQATNFP